MHSQKLAIEEHDWDIEFIQLQITTTIHILINVDLFQVKLTM